jgi:hypothetical protein
MTAGTRTIHPDEKVKAGKLGQKMMMGGFAAGIALLVVSVVLGYMKEDHWRRFMYAYLTGWLFIVSIAIGAVWYILIHHLTRSRWSTVLRRLAECITGAFPVIGVFGLVFILPMLAGYGDLYYWSNKAARTGQAAHHFSASKQMWLEPWFFAARFVFYIAFYTAVARYFAGLSRKQDETGDPNLSEKMRIASGPGMLAFALVTILFGFDLIMSLAPKWYSTIFSVNFWGGAMIGFYAFLTLLAMGIQRTGRLTHSITTEHYHDLGKWVFAFVFFWAYTAFSQFMLIWYGNIPEETVWYKYRMFSDWQWVSIAVGIGQWAFPFLFLLSRWTKRILPSLVAFCVWVLVFHWLDLYWNVMPNINWTLLGHEGSTYLAGPLAGDPVTHKIGFSAVDVTTWLGLIGILVAGVGMSLKGNLIPVKDPQLPNSLSHENF